METLKVKFTLNIKDITEETADHGMLILLSLKHYLDMQSEEFSKDQIIHVDEKSGCGIMMPAEIS